jgi:hypothetical protein
MYKTPGLHNTECTIQNATQQQPRITVQKWNQKQVHPRVIDSPSLSRDTRVKVILVARPLLTPAAQKLCRCEHSVLKSRTCIHPRTYFASKSFAGVCEPFSNAYSDKEEPNKTTIHRLVTKFRDTGSVCLWQVVIERQNSWNFGRNYFKQCISSSSSSSSSPPPPPPPQALQSVVDFGFHFNFPPFLTVLSHCMPISYSHDQEVHQLQEFNIATGFVVLCVQGFVCSRYGWAFPGTFCRISRSVS